MKKILFPCIALLFSIQSTFCQTYSGKYITGKGSAIIDGPARIGEKIPSFNNPYNIALDSIGNIYVADSWNRVVRKVTPDGTTSTYIGTGWEGTFDGDFRNAKFGKPRGVAINNLGELIVTDESKHSVRKVSANRITSTVGSVSTPTDVVFDKKGNYYVTSSTFHCIYKFNTDGTNYIFAGNTSGTSGKTDGQGTNAKFNAPASIDIDSDGNLYVADFGNHLIRKITPTGLVSTFAGSGTGAFANGKGTAASFNKPIGIALDSLNNVYVSDFNNRCIRKITPTAEVTTIAGEIKSSNLSVDGPALNAIIPAPSGIAVGKKGVIFFMDVNTGLLRKIENGYVTTLVGYEGSDNYVEGKGTAASFWDIYDMVIDSKNNIYVHDDKCIRKVTTSGNVSLYAGLGVKKKLNNMYGMCMDKKDNLFFCDSNNVYKITPDGVLSHFAGNGAYNTAGIIKDGVKGVGNVSNGVMCPDNKGNIYISNYYLMRRIDSLGTVTTLAGKAWEPGNTDGQGVNARFGANEPMIADNAGNILIFGQSKVRKLTPDGSVKTILGKQFNTVIDGDSSIASFKDMGNACMDKKGNIYLTCQTTLRKITPNLTVSTIAGGGINAEGDPLKMDLVRCYAIALDTNENIYISSDPNNESRINKLEKVILTNLESYSIEESKSIFPNPAINQIFLNINPNNDTYQIFSIDGNLISDGQLITNELYISNLQKGTYIIKVNHQNSLKIYKFIKE